MDAPTHAKYRTCNQVIQKMDAPILAYYRTCNKSDPEAHKSEVQHVLSFLTQTRKLFYSVKTVEFEFTCSIEVYCL